MKKIVKPEYLSFNPVAKHARTFNKAVVMVDRKKNKKAGYSKHKTNKFSY